MKNHIFLATVAVALLLAPVTASADEVLELSGLENMFCPMVNEEGMPGWSTRVQGFTGTLTGTDDGDGLFEDITFDANVALPAGLTVHLRVRNRPLRSKSPDYRGISPGNYSGEIVTASISGTWRRGGGTIKWMKGEMNLFNEATECVSVVSFRAKRSD